MGFDDIPSEDREPTDLARRLIATGNLRPLIGVLRGADGGPRCARDALTLLGDYDLDLLVRIALDTLIDEHFDDPELARRTRRIAHDDG